MKRFLQPVRKWDFWKEEQGQDLIEYALLAGFMALVAATVVPSLTTKISTVFSKIGEAMDAAGAATPKS